MSKPLILCEGGLDVGFFKKYLNYLNLNIEQIAFKSMGNKSRLFNSLLYDQIKDNVKYGKYSKVLFTADADYSKDDLKCGGLKHTEICLKEIINTLGFSEVAKYYIACNPDNKTGNIEDLILSTLDEKRKKCMNALLKCVPDKDAHSDKKIVLSGYESMFKEKPYTFEHDNFTELKELLLWLYE